MPQTGVSENSSAPVPTADTAIKRAIQRLTRMSDGRIGLSYINLADFSYIRDPVAEGFQVVNPANNVVEVTNDGTPEGDVVSVERARPGEDVVTPQEGHLPGSWTQTNNVHTPSASNLPGSTFDSNNNPIARETTIPSGGVTANNSTLRAETAKKAQTPQTGNIPSGAVGLMGTARTRPGYNEAYGPNRPNRPNDSLIGAVTDSVGRVFGPDASVVGTSGMGEYGSHRHRKGDALDFDVMDKNNQRVTNPVAMNDVAMDFAANHPTAGIGFGEGYMTTPDGQPGRMHLDLADDPNSWGKDGKGANMDPTLRDNLDFARQTGIGPTPTFGAPTPTARGLDAGPPTATGEDLSPQAHETYGQKMGDVSQMSPAEMAANGFTKRSDQEIGDIARTLSGELGPATLGALAAGDETAARELANQVASIENRAASQRFGTLKDALVGSQYNSLLDKNKAVTDFNFQKYGPVVTEKVKSFYNKEIKPDDYKIDHYYNPAISNPNWGPSLMDATKTGDHKFGNLGMRSNNSFNTERDRMAAAQRSDERGFTPSRDAGAFAGRQASARGTFGTDRSPGVGRSDFSGGGSDRSGTGGTGGSGRAGGVGSPGVGGGFSGGAGGTGRAGGVGSPGVGGGFSGGNTGTGGTGRAGGVGTPGVGGGFSGGKTSHAERAGF